MNRSSKNWLNAVICLSFLVALIANAVSFPGQANAATVFNATWDTGSNYGYTNTPEIPIANVVGYSGTGTPQANQVASGTQGIAAHSGNGYLQVAGQDVSSTANSYAYHRIYDGLSIPVTSGMHMKYWVYHFAHATTSQHMAFDLLFSDGTTLRDSGINDTSGVKMHPAHRNEPLNQWNSVDTDLSPAAGKTISKIIVAYDDFADSETGQYVSYFDDLTISTSGVSATRNTKIVTPVNATDDVVIADFDVTDYGADKTGVVDATATIQQAIDDCYNTGGGTVWLPAGTYKVSGTLQVKAFVTLRGDWRDPDNGSGSYGTVISANLASGDNGPTLFRIGGSAAVMGVTTYYPNQSAASPVPYNYTFEIPGRAWASEENYMMSSVINVTMLNSYRGIGVSTMANDHGGDVAIGQVHESNTIRNVKGTVLYRGAVAYNSADAGVWKHVRLNNSYWANAGVSYNAPSLTTLNNWTRTNGIAYTFGDLEWEQFYALEASDYNIGINIVNGQRIQFAAEFVWANIINTNVAVKVDNIDTRWGMSFLRSALSGSIASVQNNTSGYVKITDSAITGATSGTVNVSSPATSPTSYPDPTPPKTTRAVLYDVSKAPYNAPSVSSRGTVQPTADATTSIQNALNDAGAAGGGVVYVPAGWYKVATHLTVPGNVELRGASSAPQRDQTGSSAGTVLFAYEGAGTATPDTDTAFITLNGTKAGLSGLRVFHPNNNPQNAIAAYPYAIRGNGANVYIVNVGLTNAFNGIDLKTNRNDNHYVNRVVGGVFKNGIVIGASTQGWVEDCLTNGTSMARVGFGIAGWVTEGNLFAKVIDAYTRPNERLIVVDGASNEYLMNNFAYGANIGLHVVSGTANMFNLGTDNLGSSGYCVKVDGGTVKVMNLMRYNGTTSAGTVTLYNPMNL